jgi:putative DNA primase/helicase
MAVRRGNRAPLGNVILLTAEDDISDTVVPRLQAAGADPDRGEIVQMVREAGKERMFSLIRDLELLRQRVIDVGDVKVVQIDPISAYFGVGKIDCFRTTDVRALLSPLVGLANELRVLILGVICRITYIVIALELSRAECLGLEKVQALAAIASLEAASVAHWELT